VLPSAQPWFWPDTGPSFSEVPSGRQQCLHSNHHGVEQWLNTGLLNCQSPRFHLRGFGSNALTWHRLMSFIISVIMWQLLGSLWTSATVWFTVSQLLVLLVTAISSNMFLDEPHAMTATSMYCPSEPFLCHSGKMCFCQPSVMSFDNVFPRAASVQQQKQWNRVRDELAELNTYKV